MAVADLAVRVSADIKNFDKGLNSMIERATTTSKKVAMALSAIGAAVVGLGIKAIGMAADIEQTEVAFTTLLGSGLKAKQMIEDLQQFAATTPFQFPGLADAAQKLIAFGVSGKDVIPTLQRIGDVSAGIGAPIGEIAEIYGKARVQGRLFAEDINQLTGRGIPVIQELAKQFGVAESGVRELVETGQVNFGHLEQAFRSLTSEGGKFAGLMEAQSKTIAGLWSTLKDNVGLSLMSLGKTIIEVFDLKEVISGIIEKVQAISEALADFAARVEKIGLAEALNEIFSEDKKFMIFVIAGAIIGALVPALISFAVAAWAAIAPLLPFMAAGAAIAALAYLIYRAWEPVSKFFIDLWETVKDAFVVAWEWIKNLFFNYTAAGLVIKHWDTIKAFFKNLWDAVKNIFKTALDAVKNLILDRWNSIVSFFTGIRNKIVDTFNNIKDKVLEIWAKITDGVKGFINTIIDGINYLIRGINKIPWFNIGEVGKLQLSTDVPKMAAGGQVMRPGMALVGERGPELLTLPRGATVQPLDGAGTYYINVTIPARDLEELRTVQDFFRRIGQTARTLNLSEV